MKLLTTNEMTKLLRISRNTFKRLIRAGDIPMLQVGRQHRFDPEVILERLAHRPGNGDGLQ